MREREREREREKREGGDERRSERGGQSYGSIRTYGQTDIRSGTHTAEKGERKRNLMRKS